MLEIRSGVLVGTFTQSVCEVLWQKACSGMSGGACILVYPAGTSRVSQWISGDIRSCDTLQGNQEKPDSEDLRKAFATQEKPGAIRGLTDGQRLQEIDGRAG
jgi:hypothetical protein